MILTLLYHGINNTPYSNDLSLLEKHLIFLRDTYPIVWPGEKIANNKISICLTFDDACFDFYYYVFPLLQKYHIKAVLSIPTAFIGNESLLSPEKRLQAVDDFHHKKKNSKEAFCTWKEIDTMYRSHLIYPASHGHTHQDLTKDIDLEQEIILSKKILEKELNTSISCFVYPFGKFSKGIHQILKKHYPYIMRIGNSFNLSWHNRSNLIYRINCDNLQSIHQSFKIFSFLSYGLSYIKNTIRGR